MADKPETKPPKRPRAFTEKTIDDLPVRATRYIACDPGLPAFGVRVTPAGAKSFVLRYRIGTRQRIETLGGVGKVTLDDARKQARIGIGKVLKGDDPQAAKDAAKRATRLREAFSTWLTEYVAGECKPATGRLYHLAEQHIVKALGSLPVDQVEPEHVEQLHHRLRQTPYMANRTIAALSSFMTWAERNGYRRRGQNPCRGVEKFAEHGHKRYLTPDEYARLGKAIREAGKTGAISPAALTAVKLLLLTGCRPAEILALQWAHVDRKAGVLRLPDSKTGERTIQLPPEAVQLLKKWPVHLGSPYVFPSTAREHGKGTHLINLALPWKHLRKAAKIEDVRLYDACRHSFASVAISTHGHALSVVGELLGHTQAATTKRYAHLHDEAAKAAVTEIGGTIAAALKRKVTA
jgi:integrase